MTTSPLYLSKVIFQVILCLRVVASIQGKLVSQLLSNSVTFYTVTLISIYSYLKFLNLGWVINRAIGWVINRAIGWVINRAIVSFQNNSKWYNVNNFCQSSQTFLGSYIPTPTHPTATTALLPKCTAILTPSSHKKDRILDILSRPPV